jgi:haloacetate dehalogenase
MCEDYRAGASIDRWLDLSDKARGMQITAPLLFVWSKLGFPTTTGDPLSLSKAWTQTESGLSALSPEADMPIVGTNVC